jgi:hypothetical protein
LSNPQQILARVQRLLDTPRPAGGHPLAWSVEAFYIGDLSAIAAATLRAARSRSMPGSG